MANSDLTEDLGGVLGGLLRRRNWSRRLHLHQVFLFWDLEVGKEIARHAQPQLMKGEVLWVNVSDSVWMQQLQYEKQTLLDRLNGRLRRSAPQEFEAAAGPEKLQLADLRFHLGSPADYLKTAPPITQPPPRITIDPERLARFEYALKSIGDPDLAESLKRLWLANERRESRQ